MTSSRPRRASWQRWKVGRPVAEPVPRVGRPPVDAAEIRGAGTPSRLNGERLLGYALPLVVFAAFLLLWQYLPGWLGFHTYEVPNLSATITGLQQDWSLIGTALLVTL